MHSWSTLSAMRRATFVLASGLAAAAVAGALVYGRGSPIDAPDMQAIEVVDPEAAQPQLTPSATAEANLPTSEPPVAQGSQSPNSAADDGATRRRSRPPRDEATILADLRKRANQDVHDVYSLLLDELGLTPQQRQDLFAVLVELQVESTWSGPSDGGYQKRGRTIGLQERYDRITAAVGDEKLDEFLLLEVRVNEYWETQQIARLLRRKQVPLTEQQRDGLFGILVEVRDRYQSEPPPEIDPGSIERVAHTIEQHDEHDRLVVELAPSVLTPAQVVLLFEQYQRMAAQRASSFERSKKLSAENPKLVFYMPGSWD